MNDISTQQQKAVKELVNLYRGWNAHITISAGQPDAKLGTIMVDKNIKNVA